MMRVSNWRILNLNLTLRFINLRSAEEVIMRLQSCSVLAYPRTCYSVDPTLSPAHWVRPPCSQWWRLRPLDLLSCCSWNAVKANSCLNGPFVPRQNQKAVEPFIKRVRQPAPLPPPPPGTAISPLWVLTRTPYHSRNDKWYLYLWPVPNQ